MRLYLSCLLHRTGHSGQVGPQPSAAERVGFSGGSLGASLTAHRASLTAHREGEAPAEPQAQRSCSTIRVRAARRKPRPPGARSQVELPRTLPCPEHCRGMSSQCAGWTQERTDDVPAGIGGTGSAAGAAFRWIRPTGLERVGRRLVLTELMVRVASGTNEPRAASVGIPAVPRSSGTSAPRPLHRIRRRSPATLFDPLP